MYTFRKFKKSYITSCRTMGSWVLSLRTLNGKTNSILAFLKFTKKCNNNNKNIENYKGWVQRQCDCISDMVEVKKNNWNSHACWNTTRGKAALTSTFWSSWVCVINHRWRIAFLSTGVVMKIPRPKKDF